MKKNKLRFMKENDRLNAKKVYVFVNDDYVVKRGKLIPDARIYEIKR